MKQQGSIASGIFYSATFVLGCIAAYKGNLPVALFFAIVFASENIAVSIDHWPRLQKKNNEKTKT